MADDTQQPPTGGTPPPPPPPPPGGQGEGTPPPPPPPPPPGGAQPQEPAGPPPPRPGQNVPDGGLDPSQVFASPPPPPPPPPQQGAAGAGDDAAQPPQDSGPPPPPPGVQVQIGQGPDGKPAPEGKGYDEEDIRVLGEIGNYRFSSITNTLTNDNVVVPAHPETQFDEQAFLTYLRGSISLTRDEKWRIIQAIPKLSQFQIDELQKILDEEKKKFSELSPKHLLQLQKLEAKHAEDWKDLQTVTVQKDAQNQEQQQADDIRKQLGL